MKLINEKLNCSESKKIAILGTYLPTRCGIATFTSDLHQSLVAADSRFEFDVIAINEHAGTQYDESVRYEIAVASRETYVDAAEFINEQGYDAVSIQHEYGIFGGVAGSFLLDFVWHLKVPIVTTLHTVLDDPSLMQKLVLEALLDQSYRIVVMSEKAVDLLVQVHGVEREKIEMIPHGIPVIPEEVSADYRLGTEIESPMILTFGLLSPDKGIQYVIEAMPEIVKAYPGATYAIVGATHPHILESQGESYRQELIDLAIKLKVADNVKFVNEFLPLEELVGYLSAMDIYITPYLKPNQITSGTLAYAVGAGKAVISTPYWYANELLAEGRGLIVPFRDSAELASAVISIESDPAGRREMGERAAKFGRAMLWTEVSLSYVRTLTSAAIDSKLSWKSPTKKSAVSFGTNRSMPALNTNHLLEMTDDTGILQHANHSIPLRSEGYCVDDNARALLLTALIENYGELPRDLDLIQSRLLSFVLDAFNSEGGRFRNFMSYQRDWLETEGSEDSHGRTVWALGTFIHRCGNKSRREVAVSLFKDSLPAFDSMRSPRTWAYGILGAEEYLNLFPHDLPVKALMTTLSSRLLERFEASHHDDWPWFEDSLHYANARLSQALITAGHTLRNELMAQAGLRSLHWLRAIQTSPTGHFRPIGSEGSYIRGGLREDYDQQPIEACASVSCYLTAWKVTGHAIWLSEAHRAFQWFLGENSNGVSLYDERNGGCFDGLHPDRLNKNQGAESTLSFLCALTEMRTAVMSDSPIDLLGVSYESK